MVGSEALQKWGGTHATRVSAGCPLPDPLDLGVACHLACMDVVLPGTNLAVFF